MQQIGLNQAQNQLPALIDAAIQGETVLITLDNQQAVRLVPVPLPRPSRRAGSAKGLIVMAADFDEPLSDFDDYMPCGS